MVRHSEPECFSGIAAPMSAAGSRHWCRFMPVFRVTGTPLLALTIINVLGCGLSYYFFCRLVNRLTAVGAPNAAITTQHVGRPRVWQPPRLNDVICQIWSGSGNNVCAVLWSTGRYGSACSSGLPLAAEPQFGLRRPATVGGFGAAGHRYLGLVPFTFVTSFSGKAVRTYDCH
jgi:hypothetical protein